MLIDEYTRECLSVHVDWSIRAMDVITVVEEAPALRCAGAFVQ